MEANIYPELVIATEIATGLISALIFITAATLIGRRQAKEMGILLLGGGALIASVLCIGGELVGAQLGRALLGPTPTEGFAYNLDLPGRALGEAMFKTSLGYALLGPQLVNVTAAHVGLLIGIALAGILIPPVLANFIKGQSKRFIIWTWLGACAIFIFCFWAAGTTGVLLIAWPTVILFWLGLYRATPYLLPLDDPSQRGPAFKSLVSFAMGTNYPFYVMHDGKLMERVKGNAFLQFFAGPGIVYTSCDHVAYVTDGVNVKGVFEPGLNFTGMFDQKPRLLDLRSQLRAFWVEALTKDGIPVRVLTFAPFRIDTGGQKVTLGQSFPFHRPAIGKIVSAELVERKRKKAESGEKHEWDGGIVPLGLVPVVVTRIVQDIISGYTVDELCAQLDAARDPRVEIAAEMRKRAKEALLPMGLELIGGGISNLIPGKDVIERRLDNWRTDWERKIMAMMNEDSARYAGLKEQARGKAQVEIISRLEQRMSEIGGQGNRIALLLRFIDCLNEMNDESDTRSSQPETTKIALRQLRGQVENWQR